MSMKATLGAASVLAILAASASAQATHPETGEALAESQVFTYRVLDEVPTIDPGLVEDSSGGDIVRQTHEGLYNQDAQGNIEPGVALSHTVSDDGLVYTFTLRPEAKWSNGDPVVAGDFVYAWRRVADPATASAYQWYMELMSVQNAAQIIAGELPPDQLGIRAVDDHTLEVTLTQPLTYFPQMMAHYTTFPVHPATVEEHGSDWVQPENTVGNGAYVMTEYVPSERLVMERNEQYWDNANTVLERIEALIINDENQALTRFLADEVDYTHIPAGQYPRLVEELPTEVMSVPELCSYYYNVNLREDGPEALKDQRVREALALAIDRDIIAEAVLASGQVPAYTLTHWATAGWSVPEVPAAAMTQEERNARAQELMAEAGYGEGGEPLTLEILYNTSEAHESVAVAVGQMWKQTLGVETTLANQEWQTFLDVRKEGGYDIARAGWCGDYNEASTFLDIMQTNSGYNDSKFSNARLDELLAQAKSAEDPLPLYTEAETIISTEFPILPVYHYAAAYMLDSRVKDFPTENVQNQWYGRDLYVAAE